MCVRVRLWQRQKVFGRLCEMVVQAEVNRLLQAFFLFLGWWLLFACGGNAVRTSQYK